MPVDETVSLRDLPATIVELVGLGPGSSVPGPIACEPGPTHFGAYSIGPLMIEPVISELTALQSHAAEPRAITGFSRAACLTGQR